MPVAGNIIHELWLYLDDAGAPLGGMVSPTNATLKLFVNTGSGFVLSSDTVTWAAVSGQTGYYDISYTPSTGGLYKLDLEELNGMLRRWHFTQEVLASGAVFLPDYANAYCAESDIERRLQQAIDTSTSPDDTETAAFAVERAAVLSSLCARLGYPVTPTTVPTGSRLETLLRTANEIGAAMDFTAAQILAQQPSVSGQFEYLRQLWIEYVGGPQPGFVTEAVGLIEKEISMNLVSLASNHILSGDTLSAPVTSAPTDAGVGPISMGDLF